MASRILNIFNDIERGRKNCINNAKAAGITISDNANFDNISVAFLEKNTPEAIPNTWQRPSDWWDCETILRNAEERVDDNDNTVYPLYIVLFNNSSSSLDFSETSSYNLGGSAYLTSDGVWYGTPALHTWDKTKDKPCSEGYSTRYVIVYGPSKTTNYNIYVNNALKPLEIIIGESKLRGVRFQNNDTLRHFKALEISDVSGFSPNNSDSFSNCFSLESFEVANSFSISINALTGCVSLKVFNCPNLTGMYTNPAMNSTSIEEIILPNLTTLTMNNTGCHWGNNYSIRKIVLPKITTTKGSMFSNLYNLRELNLPLLTTIEGYNTSQGEGYFCSCDYALTNVNLPSLNITGPYSFQNCYSLKNVNLNSAVTISRFTFSSCRILQTISLPSALSLEEKCFSECFNLSEVSTPLVQNIGSGIFYRCYSLKKYTVPSSIVSIHQSAFNDSYLTFIELPYDFKLNNTNFSGATMLGHECLVDIIDKLADVTEEESTYTITLGSTNLAKLTAEEIAVATAKGWTVA